jgi:hypothetical protein
MSYDPTGPYRPDSSYEPWQQPPDQQYGVSSPAPGYPPPAYPTSGGGYPPPAYPQPGYPQAPPPKRNTALIVTLIAVIVAVICIGGVVVTVIAVNKTPTAGHTAQPGGTTNTADTNTGDARGGGGSGNLSTNGTVPFGADHSAQWSDKIQATVVSVVKFTPSKTAAGTHSGQVGIKVTVKITNNSGKRIDLTLARVKVKSGANGNKADTIIDLENNLGLGFDGAVPPGNAATATYGFSVPSGDLAKIDVEVSPDFEHDSAIFEGAAS